MASFSLLATKIGIPPQPQWTVARAALLETLENQVPLHRLTLVTAPAGYGKTTLASKWAQQSALSVAWLSLGEEDNHFERFLRYLLAAWKEVEPGVDESPLGVLLGGQSPDRDAVLTAFTNVGSERDEHLVFVLDDVHLIDEPSILAALAFLLDYLPPALHFVLCSRGEPALPLARYRARRQIFELGATDLRFSLDESRDFLARRIGPDLPAEDAARLHAQTEGWVAGLQLAALAMRHREGLPQARPAVTGRQRFVAEYLSADVLGRLPVGMRQFLLQTSILERLCAPLATAVTGVEASQELLEELVQEELFLIPLDDSRNWFRYHRLFADFLRAELQSRHPQELAGLHRRAARWFLAQGLPEPAFQHALDGQDVETVLQIFNEYVNLKLPAGEIRVVQEWLDALPAAWTATYPVLELAQAGVFAFTGAVEDCRHCLDDVEQRLSFIEQAEAQWQMARVTALRCYLACFQDDLAQAETLAARALRELEQEDEGFRPGVYGALGDLYRRRGRWEEARSAYHQALAIARSSVVQFYAAHVFGALADMALLQGRLRAAREYWQKALEAVQQQKELPSLPLPVVGWLYIRLGEILYEWNEVADAWEYVSAGLQRAELGGDVRGQIAGNLLAARIRLTSGDVEAAGGYLERAGALVEEASFPEWTSLYERRRLEWWLAEDNLRAAARWADEMAKSGRVVERPESEMAQLALARTLIIIGDRTAIEQAQALLGGLGQAADQAGRERVLIEALALYGLVQWRRGDLPSAMTDLERALRLAEPEGYVRLFADLGLSMGRLLQEARARGVMPVYVDSLLAAFDELPSALGTSPAALPEPLTAREQEVLELLAAGLTNREIGDELVISPQTVKKHTGNIYGKLRVSNRTEAVAHARELSLLE